MSARKNVQNRGKDSASDFDSDNNGQQQQGNSKNKQQLYRAASKANNTALPWTIAGVALLGCLYLYSNGNAHGNAVQRQARAPLAVPTTCTAKPGTGVPDSWCLTTCRTAANNGDPNGCPSDICTCSGTASTTCASGSWAGIPDSGAPDTWCQMTCEADPSKCPYNVCKCLTGSGLPNAPSTLVCPAGKYLAIPGTTSSDSWCQASCTNPGAPYCPPDMCKCAPPAVPVSSGWQPVVVSALDKNVKIKYNSPTKSVILSLTDSFVPGDRMTVKLDGQTIGQTSSVAFQITKTCSSNADNCFADNRWSHGVFELPAGSHEITLFGDTIRLGVALWYFRLDVGVCTNPAGTIKIVGATPYGQAQCGSGYSIASPKAADLQNVFNLMDSCYPARTQAWIAGYDGNPAQVESGNCLTVTSGTIEPGSGASGAVVPAANCGVYLPAICYKN